MQVSPARRAAFEILRRVEADDAYASSLLAQTDDHLQPNDRALCHELVLGVLRWRLWLDRSLEYFSNRKVGDFDLPVALALRIGLYQLRFLSRVPASAAINESVNLVKTARVKSAASFVNAVLRRATREPSYDPASTVTDEVEKLAIETSHPRWLLDRWISQFGFAEAAAIARANNEPAPLAFRFTTKAIGDRAPEIIYELQSAGAELIESRVAPGGWRIIQRKSTGRDAGDPQAGMPALRMPALRMPALQELSREGLIYFQDEASQLVAHLVDARADERVLDVCAAPGSKSTLIAALSPQSTVIAGELYEHRARTIKEFSTQQGAGNVHVVVHDARAVPFSTESFDRVLVDAPCSGTGTLRHNPEIRWRLQPSDIEAMAEKQMLILEHAADAVRPGGVIIYSTCSLEREENEAVIARFTENGKFSAIAFDSPPRLLATKGAIRTWPHHDDVEGFFVAALRKS
jgi:16S rRNA (cytosine967-C5)-methyltransferase